MAKIKPSDSSPAQATDPNDRPLRPLRIPAADIEAIVSAELQRLFKTPTEIVGEVGTGSLSDVALLSEAPPPKSPSRAAQSFSRKIAPHDSVLPGMRPPVIRSKTTAKRSSPSASDHARIAASASRLATRWPDLGTSEQRDILVRVVQRITIADSELRIAVNRTALIGLLLDKITRQTSARPSQTHGPIGDMRAPPEGQTSNSGLDIESMETNAAEAQFAAFLYDTTGSKGAVITGKTTSDLITIMLPLTLRRGAGMLRLILPNAMSPPTNTKSNDALVNAIARAHIWMEGLIDGEFASITDIARHEGIAERYATKILHLVFFSPSIIESILTGDMYTFVDLQDPSPPPKFWKHQRRRYVDQSRHAPPKADTRP